MLCGTPASLRFYRGDAARETLAGRLAALGFADTARAERLLTEDLRLDVADADAGLVDAIAAAADPDLALTALARLPDEAALLAALRADHGLRDRLTAVLGTSVALGEHLARHPASGGCWPGPRRFAVLNPGNCEPSCWPRPAPGATR